MLVFEFFRWWYSSGYLDLLRRVKRMIETIWYTFSVSTLVRTLFAPWKQIQTRPGNTVQGHFQAIVDNTISRFVGLFIRLFTLIAALICLVIVSLISLILIVAWPLLPLGVPVLLVVGFL